MGVRVLDLSEGTPVLLLCSGLSAWVVKGHFLFPDKSQVFFWNRYSDPFAPWLVGREERGETGYDTSTFVRPHEAPDRRGGTMHR